MALRTEPPTSATKKPKFLLAEMLKC
jgi:hypothetical protein